MKKIAIVLVTVVSLGFIAAQSWAYMGCRGWGGPGGNYRSAAPTGYNQAFVNETAQLRADLAAKQAQYTALLAQPGADPEQTGKVSQEIVAIQGQLRAKAQAYGVTGPWHNGYAHGGPMGNYGHGGYYCGW